MCRPARRASSRSQPKPGHRYQERAGVSFGVYAYIYMGGCSLQIYVSVSTYLHIHRRTPAHIYKHPRTRVYIYWVSFCGCFNTFNSSDGASARSSFDRSAHVLGVDQKQNYFKARSPKQKNSNPCPTCWPPKKIKLLAASPSNLFNLKFQQTDTSK